MTLYTRLGGWGIRGRPPETSPCPSPSHRPGEGDLAEAVVPIGSAFAALPMLKMPPTSTTAPTESPSPGRWEGDGRGDRGEVPGGGKPRAHRGRKPGPPLLRIIIRSRRRPHAQHPADRRVPDPRLPFPGRLPHGAAGGSGAASGDRARPSAQGDDA